VAWTISATSGTGATGGPASSTAVGAARHALCAVPQIGQGPGSVSIAEPGVDGPAASDAHAAGP
jgi:hypothetical protein